MVGICLNCVTTKIVAFLTCAVILISRERGIVSYHARVNLIVRANPTLSVKMTFSAVADIVFMLVHVPEPVSSNRSSTATVTPAGFKENTTVAPDKPL